MVAFSYLVNITTHDDDAVDDDAANEYEYDGKWPLTKPPHAPKTRMLVSVSQEVTLRWLCGSSYIYGAR